MFDMISIIQAMFSCSPKLSVFMNRVSAHIEHVRSVAGVEHVGLGAGYDGINL